MTHWQRAHPRARKEHTCWLCARTIEPGETYMRGSGMDGSRAWTWRECAHCEALARLEQGRGDYDEYDFDLLWEFLPESMPEARVRAQLRRRWRRLDGTLYPVPELVWREDRYGFGWPVSIRPGEPTASAA